MHPPSFKLFKTSHLDAGYPFWKINDLLNLKPWIFPNGLTFLEHKGKNYLKSKDKKSYIKKKKVTQTSMGWPVLNSELKHLKQNHVLLFIIPNSALQSFPPMTSQCNFHIHTINHSLIITTIVCRDKEFPFNHQLESDRSQQSQNPTVLRLDSMTTFHNCNIWWKSKRQHPLELPSSDLNLQNTIKKSLISGNQNCSSIPPQSAHYIIPKWWRKSIKKIRGL